jgi:hypothetical protein
MKTKTTFQKTTVFSSSMSRFGLLTSEAFLQKLSLKICKIFLILILVFNVTVTFGQSNSCQANLIVDHNLNVGSTSPEGTYYSMIITNTGASADTFSLSSLNINTTCSNTDGSNTADNVNLETTFVDINLSPLNEISLRAGESIHFYSHVTIPAGTDIKKWCCTQVIAESKSCSNYKVSTVLHTYFSGPTED